MAWWRGEWGWLPWIALADMAIFLIILPFADLEGAAIVLVVFLPLDVALYFILEKPWRP